MAPLVARVQNLYIRQITLKMETAASMSKVKGILRDLYERMLAADARMKTVKLYYDVDPVGGGTLVRATGSQYPNKTAKPMLAPTIPNASRRLAIQDKTGYSKMPHEMIVMEKRGGNDGVIGFFVVILCLDFEQELLK